MGGLILKLKVWVLWLFAGICFLFSGTMQLIDNRYLLGVMFIFLGGTYLILSIVNYKGDKKSNKISVQNTISDNINIELKTLLAEGKRIQAIKKYRMVTGLGLKEAKEYIDNLR